MALSIRSIFHKPFFLFSAGQLQKHKTEWFTDAVFVVPHSGSIGVSNYWKVKYFLSSVAENLNIGSDGTHVGLVDYGKYARTISPLGQTKSVEDFETKLNAIAFEKGQNYIDRALKLASRELFAQNGRGRRDGVPKVLVLVTYEKQTQTSGSGELSAVAQSLKDDGVSVFAVGIGDAVKVDELLRIGSDNSSTFIVNKFDDLPEFRGDVTNAVFDASSKCNEE